MRLIVCCLVCLMGRCVWAEQRDTPFVFERDEQGVSLLEGGSRVYFFQLKEKSLDGKWPRANYIHPLYGLDGRTLTEDFPTDHGHHRGIFWAWHQLKLHGKPLADPWICQGIQWLPPAAGDGVKTELLFDRATLRVTRQWTVQQDGRPLRVVEERAAVTAYVSGAKLRRLDFDVRLRALVEGLSIGGSENAKGYGGFSTRLKLQPGVRFLGKQGQVAPQTTAVDAGWWLDIVSPAADATHVAVLCHRSHPHKPQAAPQWILRSQRSMQNVAWPGRQAVKLATDKELVLRYRLLLHRGELGAEAIQQHWKAYSQVP